MALLSKHFRGHLELCDFINAQAIARASTQKIDVDSLNGGWVIWWWTGGGPATMTLYAKHFMTHGQLTDFINAQGIIAANILKIDADSANGGWCLFWYA